MQNPFAETAPNVPPWCAESIFLGKPQLLTTVRRKQSFSQVLFFEIDRIKFDIEFNNKIRCATRLYVNNVTVFWIVGCRTETDGLYPYSCNRFILPVLTFNPVACMHRKVFFGDTF